MMLWFAFALIFFPTIALAQSPHRVTIETDLLAWDAPMSGGAIANYRVECRDLDTGMPAVPITTGERSVPLRVITQGVPIEPGVPIRCLVAAMNEAGEALALNEVTFTAGGRARTTSSRVPTSAELIVIKPGPPKNVRVVPGPTDE